MSQSESDDDCQIIPDPSVKLEDLEEDEESLCRANESAGEAEEADSIDYYTVSPTNPRFDIIVSHSHVNRPHYLIIPTCIALKLPCEKVPTVLKYMGRRWSMFYNGHNRAKVLELKGWRKFSVDNELKIGDCCVFELIEASRKKIEFKVVIIKTDPSYWGRLRGSGGTADEPITL